MSLHRIRQIRDFLDKTKVNISKITEIIVQFEAVDSTFGDSPESLAVANPEIRGCFLAANETVHEKLLNIITDSLELRNFLELSQCDGQAINQKASTRIAQPKENEGLAPQTLQGTPGSTAQLQTAEPLPAEPDSLRSSEGEKSAEQWIQVQLLRECDSDTLTIPQNSIDGVPVVEGENQERAERVPLREVLEERARNEHARRAATMQSLEEMNEESHQGLQPPFNRSPQHPEVRSSCQVAELGESMVPTIAKITASLGEQRVTDCGFLILQVESLPPIDWTEVSQHVSEPKEDETKGFSFMEGPSGIAHSYRVAHDINFSFPDFSESETFRFRNDPEQDFEDAINHAPAGDLPYYVGPPLGHFEFTQLLHPGEKLLQRNGGKLPGISSVYWYISTCAGTPANLHVEDANTGSVNLLLTGAPKDWLFIPQHSMSKLEEDLKEVFLEHESCSQFVRHLDFLLSPSWLKERGIDYFVVRQNPGEMVCTFVNSYHQVKNCGKNFALAINFEFSHWPDMPENYKWCTKKCGQHALTMKNFRLPRESMKSQNNIEKFWPKTRQLITTVRSREAETVDKDGKVGDDVSSKTAEKGGVSSSKESRRSTRLSHQKPTSQTSHNSLNLQRHTRKRKRECMGNRGKISQAPRHQNFFMKEEYNIIPERTFWYKIQQCSAADIQVCDSIRPLLRSCDDEKDYRRFFDNIIPNSLLSDGRQHSSRRLSAHDYNVYFTYMTTNRDRTEIEDLRFLYLCVFYHKVIRSLYPATKLSGQTPITLDKVRILIGQPHPGNMSDAVVGKELNRPSTPVQDVFGISDTTVMLSPPKTNRSPCLPSTGVSEAHLNKAKAKLKLWRDIGHRLSLILDELGFGSLFHLRGLLPTSRTEWLVTAIPYTNRLTQIQHCVAHLNNIGLKEMMEKDGTDAAGEEIMSVLLRNVIAEQ